MKKLVFLLTFLFITVAIALPVFAQNNQSRDTSNMYYVNVKVERIYPTRLGYLVQYRKSATSLGFVGIPNEWFSAAAGKAEYINLPRGPAWPTLTVFYRDGEFSHVRLYVHRSKGHITWGNMPQSTDVSAYFTNTESITLEFE